MKSSNSLVYHCFPILVIYIADCPEQVLVTLVKTGEYSVCNITQANIGDISNIYYHKWSFTWFVIEEWLFKKT